jgi:subtilisin-like proprotein convertase family protein
MIRRTMLLICAAALLAWAASPIDGKWKMNVKDNGGEVIRQLNLEIAIAEGKATGKLASSDLLGSYSDGVLNLEFPYVDEESGGKGTLKLNGKLEGEKLTGDWKFGASGGTFDAVRAK